MSQRKKVLLSEAALLLCGVIWGTGFVVMKNSLDYLSINWLLAIRFFIAGIIFFFAVFKKMVRARASEWKVGLYLGGLLYAAYLLQTIGLNYTTAGNNAFLTAVYVVLVPFFLWILQKKRPSIYTMIAGVVCLTGVGVIALNEGLTVGIGDGMTLLCGVVYALHILLVAHYAAMGMDVLVLTCMQFLFSALFAGVGALLFEPLPAASVLFAPETAWSLIYLATFCTIIALGMQNMALKYAPTSHASLLMSTEAPFGFLAGMLFLNEPLTVRFIIGATLIAGSILLSELGNARAQKRQIARLKEEALYPEPTLRVE